MIWPRATGRMADSNPMKNMVMINGLIVPADMLEPEVQEELRRRGII